MIYSHDFEFSEGAELSLTTLLAFRIKMPTNTIQKFTFPTTNSGMTKAGTTETNPTIRYSNSLKSCQQQLINFNTNWYDHYYLLVWESLPVKSKEQVPQVLLAFQYAENELIHVSNRLGTTVVSGILYLQDVLVDFCSIVEVRTLVLQITERNIVYASPH